MQLQKFCNQGPNLDCNYIPPGQKKVALWPISLMRPYKKRTVIHYLKNKVGVVDFANAQGVLSGRA